MKRLQTGVLSALAIVLAASATQAGAQDLRGFRVEAQTGFDRFSSEGNHDSKLSYGAAAGVDFDAGGFAIGPEITYWNGRTENKTVEGGGLAERKSFQEWALALRAGVNVMPSTFVYGKIGYAKNEQRKRFTAIDSAGNLNDTLGYYYKHFTTRGVQYGGGVNQMIGGGGFYASAEGRYSNYKNTRELGGTHRIVGLIGLGYLFGYAAAEAAPPPPPPPPPPPAPATQTCPDGSVIDAMATCPPPPPPPPPPAPQGERG